MASTLKTMRPGMLVLALVAGTLAALVSIYYYAFHWISTSIDVEVPAGAHWVAGPQAPVGYQFSGIIAETGVLAAAREKPAKWAVYGSRQLTHPTGGLESTEVLVASKERTVVTFWYDRK